MNTQVILDAISRQLGRGSDGDLAFTRSLSRYDIQVLLDTQITSLGGWELVAVGADAKPGWITADQAVELRENKCRPTFLLVDAHGAGAGMDGIYSAAREIDEKKLFSESVALLRKITQHGWREFAEAAIKRARRIGGRRNGTSARQEFVFYGEVSSSTENSGALVSILGLWPVAGTTPEVCMNLLGQSCLMVERLLLPPATSEAPAVRVSGLVLGEEARVQAGKLEKLVRSAGGRPRGDILEQVAKDESLWLGNLRPAFLDSTLVGIEISSWRRPNDALFAWSGLKLIDGDGIPHFLIDKENPKTRLEIRWKPTPDTLPKGAVNYEVRVIAGSEVIASRQIEHSGRSEQKVVFSSDDFEDLDESAKLESFIEVSAAAKSQTITERSEDFILTFGEAPVSERVSSGEVVRCLSDGVLQATTREDVTKFIEQRHKGVQGLPDKQGFVSCRMPGMRRGFRVERPKLIQEIERHWSKCSGTEIGRWVIRCRADGFWTTELKYVPLVELAGETDVLNKLAESSRKFRENTMKAAGCLSRLYVHGHASANIAADYLNSWQAAFEAVSPKLCLAHTVEVQTPAGRTIGLVVLPSHPIRLAWQCAYDDLALHLRHEEGMPAKRVREALQSLDSAHYPFILPGIEGGPEFVFGDVLGLAAVAMVTSDDREPKAAIATIAACFAGDSDKILPALSRSSGHALSREISNYLNSHEDYSVLRINALRPGDGGTVVRALGKALQKQNADETDAEEGMQFRDVSCHLDLYPTSTQSASAGAYLTKINQRRRAGVSSVSADDAWALQSLNRGEGRILPRLRWAKRDSDFRFRPAHLAISFDSFTSQVEIIDSDQIAYPLISFGLTANLQRKFEVIDGRPIWKLWIPNEQEGVKLANRVVTERLCKIQAALARCVCMARKKKVGQPVIQTVPTSDDIESLEALHRYCDWVVTVDRNAGVEYFDSPLAVPAVYDAYLIDAVPERDDLGCLQMITSTAHFDEVRHLLDHTLAMMGLSGSARNCEFLLGHLKGLSGRLAMRLASGGQDAPTARIGSELIALCLVRSNCLMASAESECWMSLESGFFLPLDDVRDLVPEDATTEDDAENADESLITGDSRRADLLFISVAPKGRLQFRFVEVKYRRHLAAARASALVEKVVSQTAATRNRWMEWFFGASLSTAERAIRAGRLARTLRFYADKAVRHYLAPSVADRLYDEIDRMLKDPASYEPGQTERSDRAFVFCPDFSPLKPEELFPGLAEECRVWLFGSDTLPDRPYGSENIIDKKNDIIELISNPAPSAPCNTVEQNADKILDPVVPAGNEPAQNETTLILSSVVNLGQARDGRLVSWSPSIASNPHLMIAGLPGMGKTTCLINICRQLINCNIIPIVFSYHDDIDEKLAKVFPKVRLGDPTNLGFNPMRITHDSALAHIESAGQLRDIFSAIFPDLGELQLEQLRRAIKSSYTEQGWGGENSQNASVPSFRRFVEILRKNDRPDARTQTLLARLAELDDFEFFKAEESGMSLLNTDQPLVLQIHAFRSEAMQRAYASFALYSIYQDMFKRGRPDRITHAIIFDEAHRAAKLKLIPVMAKECRKYGLAMAVASQEARDFDAGLYSAIANYLILRVTDQDARALARNVAPSEIERRTADRLKTLPKYEALYFSEENRQPIHLQLCSD
jgi:DNA phosphorothioation-dependent restriction protein DptH